MPGSDFCLKKELILVAKKTFLKRLALNTMTIISLDILSYLTLGFVEKDERKLLALCSTVYLILSNLSLDSEILNVFPSEKRKKKNREWDSNKRPTGKGTVKLDSVVFSSLTTRIIPWVILSSDFMKSGFFVAYLLNTRIFQWVVKIWKIWNTNLKVICFTWKPRKNSRSYALCQEC